LYITQVNKASADLNQDTIVYHPDSEIYNDYINYTLVDSIGTYARGTVYVVYENFNVPIVDSIYYNVSNSGSLIVLMPHGGFSQTNSNLTGNINELNSAVFKYTVTSDTALTEELLFIANNGNERSVFINVLVAESEGSLVEDDVYTPKNTNISFNPLANDNTFNDITGYSSELTLSSGNTLNYTPPAGFVGVKKLWYEVDFGTYAEVEDIYIYVGNLNPQTTVSYNFNTLLNTDLVIAYDIPLDGYYFEELNAPAHGSIYIETGEVDDDCNNYELASYIRYVPFQGYFGKDEFSVKYCVNNSNTCKNYKVYVDVLNETAADCNCEGPDCIWAGDINKDGRVSVRDILPIGLEFGRVGEEREQNSNWIGAYGGDWDSNYYQGINSKNADANGDGIIDVADVQTVDENYSKVHNFVPEENFYLKDYSLVLDFQQTEVDSGDLLLIDIILGSEAFPVLDMEGFAFRMNIAQGIADSASMTCDWKNDSWLSKNASNITLDKVPIDGTLDAGFAKSSGLPASGFGIVATVSFIVEDELNGFKLGDNNKFEFNIDLSDAIMQDASGRLFKLPNATASGILNLKQDNDTQLSDKDLIIFPNPAINETRIHLNGRNSISEIQVVDMQGRVMHSVNNVINNDYRLDVSSLIDGLYIINVYTDKGVIGKKLMIQN
jgi:hypothetical protein